VLESARRTEIDYIFSTYHLHSFETFSHVAREPLQGLRLDVLRCGSGYKPRSLGRHHAKIVHIIGAEPT